jgi:hypothetical protein
MLRISCAKTTDAVRQRRKLVTRRRAGTWKNLKAGQLLLVVDKIRGLKKGQAAEKLAVVRVVSVRLEPLKAITGEDVALECLAGADTPEQFIAAYCSMNGELPDCETRRIEWEYVHWPGSTQWNDVLSGVDPDTSVDFTLLDGPTVDELLVLETAKRMRWLLAKRRSKGHNGWNQPTLWPAENLKAELLQAAQSGSWTEAAAVAAMLALRKARGFDGEHEGKEVTVEQD